MLSYPLLDVCFARRATFGAIPGATLEDQPSKALEVAISRCHQSGILAPRTSLLSNPLQGGQVTTLSGYIAHYVRTPRTAVLSRPLQAFQLTVSSCLGTRDSTPRASLAPSPLQAFQLTASSCPGTCILRPWAALAPSPLQAFQVTVQSGLSTSALIPSTPLASQPLQSLQLTATGCPRTSPCIHQARYLVLWYLAPVPFQHAGMTKIHSNHYDAIHALLSGFTHNEAPAPPSAPVFGKVAPIVFSILPLIPCLRHELSPGLLLRLAVLLRCQRKGQNILVFEFRRDHRPNLRREPGDRPPFRALARLLPFP